MRHLAWASVALSCALTACSPGSDAPMWSDGARDRHDPHRAHKKDVIVLDDHDVGIEGVLLAVHTSDGHLERTARTGPDGSVRVEVPKNGSVTRYTPYSLGEGFDFLEVETVFDADKGPVRFLDYHHGDSDPVPLMTTYEITVADAPPEATWFLATSRCMQNGGWFPPDVGIVDNGACSDEPDDFVLVYAMRGDFEVLAWGYVGDLPTNPGGVVPVVVDVTHTASYSRTITVHDLPPEEPQWAWGAVSGMASWDRWGLASSLGPISHDETTDGTSMTSTSLLPDIAVEGWRSETGAVYTNGSAWAYDWAKTPGDVELSFDGLPLLDVVGPHTSQPPGLSWTTDEDVDADGVLAGLAWGLGDGRYLAFQGAVQAEAAGEVALPEFPAEFAHWLPDSDDTLFQTAVLLFDSSLIDSWEDVLGSASRLGFGADPVEGSLVVTASFAPPVPNDLPTVEFTSSSIADGLVTIEYTLADTEGDGTWVYVEGSIGDESYFLPTQVGGDPLWDALETSPDGVSYTFVWQPDLDLPGYSGDVTLTFWVNDDHGGEIFPLVVTL